MIPVVSLSDVVQSRTETANPTTTPDASFVYVDIAAVDSESKRIATQRTLLGRDAPSRARKVIRGGDVIVSTVRPNLNAVAMVPPELDQQIASTGFCVLRANERMVPEFLYFYTRSPRFIDGLCRLTAGAMYPAVTDGQVLSQQLPLPPLPEQRRIVDVLGRAEGLVRLHRQAVAKTREIIPALFLDLFGDPASNPKGWPVVTLGELISDGPQNGLYKHASAYGAGTPILRIDAFYDGQVSDLPSPRRVALEPAEIDKFAIRLDDIVINRVNSPEYLGKSTIIPQLREPTVFESNMMRMSVDHSRAGPVFVIEQLQTAHVRAQIMGHAKHAINQSSINQQDVKALTFPLPPLALQTRFASQVTRIRSLQSQAETALAKAQASFQSLLHRAFESPA